MNELNGLEIAVIGIGCRFPKSSNRKAYWELLEKGESGISYFSEEELIKSGVPLSDIQAPNYVRAKGKLDEIEYFDAGFFGYTEQEASYLNPQHRIILECAYNALLDGGYSENKKKLPIGVYASEDTNTYMFNLMKDPHKMNDISQIMMLNAKDFLSTTISYKLNLFGQSVNVQCGCSSSLVAVHMACQALLSGDIDMALAGGVTVHFPNTSGYFYTPEGKFSPDGHVRALSQDAQGYVISDGAGVVLLKRYEDAIRDKDPVYCVIKASYVNNDGRRKQNFAAPSEEGEYESISNAFAIAEVDPSTVSYVEAHGTGTLIGDTMELAAWSRYFRKNSKASKYCAIGSVDNNIGHADAVSGIAKLIKVALMLQNKKLVKNLNSKNPNHNISSDSSPFYINEEGKDWDVACGVRRAAVSSFGVGGTNAVLILEEAEPEKNEYADEFQIMPLSAHSSLSMAQLKKNLAENLAQQQNVSEIYDIATTYAKEAKVFKQREFFVYKNKEKLIEWLNKDEENAEQLDLSQHSIVILFSGQGNQYVELSRDLDSNLPVFHKYFDECLNILKEHHDFDYLSYQSEKANIKDDFFYSQISIFIYQYSMFQTIVEFGVKPSLLIGHSLGEYVAACVSGVFSLKDAIYLVYSRAKLIERTKDGDMMVVCKNEQEIRPYLSENVAIAAINDRFSVSVSGTADAVLELKQKLESEAVACIEIGTKKAIHSPIMWEIADEYTKILKSVQFHLPSQNWVSTIEPGLVKEEVACPEYWIKNLCNTVRFYDGIQYIRENSEKQLYLELGPGNALYSLLRTIHRKAVCYPVLQSGLASKGMQSLFKKVTVGEYESFLNTIGLLWRGQVIDDISCLYKGKETGKASMVPYPFDRKKYWYTDKYSAGQMRDRVKGKHVILLSKEEKMLIYIWTKVLKHHDFGIEDPFFYVGGNSLKIVKMQALLEEEGFEIEVDTLYKLSTIKELAMYIADNFVTNDIQDYPIEITAATQKAVIQNKNYGGYNEFVYQNCFFNQIFAMLKANEVSPMVILSNDILMYRLEDLLKVEYQSNMDIEDALKAAGLKVFQEEKADSVQDKIKKAVKEGRCVILGIDCFKEKSRAETYMKEHVSTMLLVYDYNECTDRFSAIERKYIDTLSYQERVIEASELVDCYEEYIRYYQESARESHPSYFEFDVTEKKENINFKEKYSKYFKLNVEKIRKQLSNIIQFSNIYEEMLKDENVLKQKVEPLIANINDIINAKKVQKRKLNDVTMFGNDETIQTLLDNIISKWGHIRNVLVKFMCSNVYSKSMKKISETFKEIYKEELDLVNYIANKLDVE
ncbi:MAG: acyltransferase domain-containing protein [Coprococcus sp.]|nr:acyltransferase domain-containing protein [Coprococcus sp.]